MIQKAAKKSDFISHESRITKLNTYPKEVLNFNLDYISGDQLTIAGLPGRNVVDDIAIWIQGNIYEGIDDATLDLSTTGLNGIVDGITLVPGDARDFLIWGFSNNGNSEFEGFGITHKPYSVYTGPASAGLGASVSFTGLVNAYQFTIGARVVIRNTVGTSPQYEWNWGTITDINSSTSIDVDMDNEVYGSALTAATGGEIKQWNKFRPWVVASSSQTLYKDFYRLLGEFKTDSSGNILKSYKVDDPWRFVRAGVNQYYNATAVNAGSTEYLGRFIPLWSSITEVLTAFKTDTAGQLIQINPRSGWAGQQMSNQVSAVFIRQTTVVETGLLASLYVTHPTASTNILAQSFILGYYIPGGMRS